MSSNMPRDPRQGSAVDPDPVVVVPEPTVVVSDRTVVLPEAAPPPPPPVVRTRARALDRDSALFLIGFLLVMLVVVALFIWVFAPEPATIEPAPPVTPPVTDTIEPDTNVARALALPAPEEMRTHTVTAAGDQDLLALATSAGAVDSFGGATVTADGVEVTQLLGDRAFEVADPTGNTMVVYLPYGTPNEVFVTIGQELTFVGSLSPTSEDLTVLADSTAATAAAAQGAFIIAVPESIHVPGPSLADEAAA
jgi:hypothetical protein